MYNFTVEKDKVVLKIKNDRVLWNQTEEKIYEKNKSKYSVQGFRKGKAPLHVVKRNYGENVFFEDTLDEIVNAEYHKFLQEHAEIVPVESPNLSMDKFDDKTVEITLSFATLPKVEFDIGKVKVKRQVVNVTEEEVGKALTSFAESHSRYVEVEKDKKAEMGDFATIDFEGKIDGKAFDGGKAENHRLELGSKSFIDGFEEGVVGMKVGDSKDIDVVFPKNYHVVELQDKPAVFSVKVNKLEKKEVPVVDDKFIADTTEFETVEDYKKDLKKHLEEHATEHALAEARNKVIDELVKQVDINIPESMLHEEVHYILDDIAQRLSYQGLSLEMYLKDINKTQEQFEEDLKPQARQSVKARLVLQKIIKDQDIKATDAELDAKIAEFAKSYNQEVETFKQSIGDNGKNYLQNQIVQDKLYAYLEQNCIE